MTVNFPGVPLDTNAIPANINAYIAKGPDYSWIGNVPDSYFSGQKQGVAMRNANAFQNGLPRDDAGNVDWNAVTEMLAKAGGTAAIQPIVALGGLQSEQSILNNPPPNLYGNQTSAQPAQLPPSTAGGSRPMTPPAASAATPQTTDQALTPSQIASANPNGVPQPVSQPTPAQTVQARFPQPQPQPQQPVQVAQAQPQPQPQGATVAGGQPDPVEARAMQLGDYYARQAQALGFNPNTKAASQAARAQADKYYAIAQQYRDARLKNAELTPEAKNATNPAIIPFEENKGAAVQQAQDATKAFGADYQSITQLGRTAGMLQDRVQAAKNLTLQPGFYSGPFAKGVESYQQFRSVFGADPSAATPAEAFNKITNDILADQIKAMGKSGVGRVLQAEVNIMKNGIASLGITAQTNRAQLEMLNRVYQEEQRYAQFAEQVRNDPRIPPQAKGSALNQGIAQWQKSHPMFTQDELQHPQLLGAPDAPPQSAQWSPQQKRAWAQSVGLQPGDPIRFNGQIQAVP